MNKLIVSILLIITVNASYVFAQQPESVEGGQPVAGAQPTGGGFLQVFKARAGGLIPLVMPMGEVGSVLGMGFGFNAFFDVSLDHLPFMSFTQTIGLPGFYTRTGLQTGIYMLSGSAANAATAQLIPFNFYAHVGWEPAPKIKPFFALGTGFGMVSVSRETVGTLQGGSVSSFDAILHVGLGATYDVTPNIEAMFLTSYNIFFEQVSGSFLIIQLGAGYKF